MNKQAWNRRDFVRAAGLAAVPALLAIPGLAQTVQASASSTEWPGLWADARSTINFYRKHLPVDLRLGVPTDTTRNPTQGLVRTVRIPIVDGRSEVGSLCLDATFQPDEPRTLVWQSTKVAGDWYQASIANAYKAGEVFPLGES